MVKMLQALNQLLKDFNYMGISKLTIRKSDLVMIVLIFTFKEDKLITSNKFSFCKTNKKNKFKKSYSKENLPSKFLNLIKTLLVPK
jgi:hypothetical protein